MGALSLIQKTSISIHISFSVGRGDHYPRIDFACLFGRWNVFSLQVRQLLQSYEERSR